MSSNQKQKIDKVEVYKKWKSLVNMTKGELEKFYNSEEGKEAGLSSSKAKSLGIHSGRESARWIMKMKDTPHDKWTPTMWDWANRQISFISRMSGNKGGLYDENGNKTRKLTSLLIWGHNPEKHKAGGSLSKTPAPKSDRIYGSEKNAKNSSKDLASSKKINFDAATLSSIKSKVQEHNKKYPSKKVTIEAAKAVVRRGMGAYSVTHRPTIKGGKPNSRVAWGLARLNAFLYKAVNGNSKSGKYSQDNDLMDELHIPHKKYAFGGRVSSSKLWIPNVRGGWTKEKIVRYLKAHSSDTISTMTLMKYISEFDNWQDLKNHIYYHGTTNYIDKGLKPSIVFSEKQAERHGGGGYGDRYYGISLTKRKRVAESFSGNSDYVEIYPVILKRDAKLIERLDLSDASEIEDIIVDLYNQGVDAVWIGGGEEELVVVNPFSIILYPKGSEGHRVFGGFKSVAMTDEQIKELYDNSARLYQEYKSKFDEAKTTEEKNAALRSFPSVKFKEGGEILLAPNGKPSKLNSQQWHLVRTPAFKKFFGDWLKLEEAKINDSGIDDVTLENLSRDVSKVIDENGEPLVVYHGTNKYFNVFEKADKVKKDFPKIRDYGMYFSSSINTAEFYSLETLKISKEQLEWQNKLDQFKSQEDWDSWADLYEYGKDKFKYTNSTVNRKKVRIIECFLNIRNPLIVDGNGNYWFTVLKGVTDTAILNKNDGIFALNMIEVAKEIQDTFVTFNSNQIKLADGSNTTFDGSNPDIRYGKGGLIAPNGNESNLTPEQYKLVRTPAFKEWFGDFENDPENSSKVVDSNGEPLPIFHGTTHEFYEFTKTRGNLDNHFGLGYYFTDSKIDVEENYLKEGADITNRVELVKERIQQKLEDEYSEYNDLIEDAENVSETYSVSVEEIEALDDFSELAEIISNKRLIGGKEIIITAFLAFFNPIDLTSIDSVYDALEHENEDGEYEENADSLPMKLFDAMNSVAYNFNEIDVQKIWNDISEDIGYDWDGVSFYQVDELMRKSKGLTYVTDENGESASNEFIRSVYEEMGYDGIIMDADLQFGNRRKFGIKMKMDRGTKHYIAFEPTQIKLSDGTNTTFDKNNPDIRYEKGGKVEEGEKFTEKGGNKIVDEKGKPLTLYHSTFSDFREFNEGINYFAENKKYSEVIAKITNRNGKSSDYVEERPIRTIPVNIAAARVYELPKGEEMNSNKIKKLINNDPEFTKKYDAVKGIDLYSKNEIVYAVFDKSNIKILEQPKEFSAESDKYFEYVPLNEIEPYKEQDREIIRKYDKSYLDEVTEDIKTNGIKRPINLEVYSGKGLVTEGNHRIAAAKRLGLKYIPVRVIDRYKDFGSINKHLAVKLPDSIPHWRYQREHPEISPLDWNNSAAAYGFTKIDPNKFEKVGVAKKDFQCANCDETFKISANDNYICPNCDYDNETAYIMSVLKPTKTLEELSTIHNVPLEQLQLQFKKGIATEMEHTTDKRIAQVIALHHIEEMPDYYDKLSLMEAKQYKKGGVADCGCGSNMKYDEGGVLIVETYEEGSGEKFLIKSTGQVIELEGGEGIMCTKSMQSDRTFSFQGNRMTGMEVASYLNSKYGGVEFKKGGEVGHVLGCKKYNYGGELPTYNVEQLEGGEGVVCLKVMESNDKYIFNGSTYTPKQILSQINLANGGKKFEEGGVIYLKKYKLQMSNKLAKMVYFAEKLLHLI